MSDDRILKTAVEGIERARAAERNNGLKPIIVRGEGGSVGICHYCESETTPGHLFCAVDAIEPDKSCSVMWEIERKRKQEMGR